eukprot:scaffold79306_cov14-Tisochrysis_lutea.AAC.1
MENYGQKCKPPNFSSSSSKSRLPVADWRLATATGDWRLATGDRRLRQGFWIMDYGPRTPGAVVSAMGHG